MIFHTILLFNVGAKIFLGILATRLTAFILDNAYMDTVQKGGIPGVSTHLEHLSIISKIFEDAKTNYRDLADTP